MSRLRLIPALALLLLVPFPAIAGYETREIDPLSSKDLSAFKVEGDGEWKTDSPDMVYTVIECARTKGETSLLFITKRFSQGFQVRCEVMGGFRNKGLDLVVVPSKGDRIVVPYSHRELIKKDWHHVVLTVEDGSAKVEVDGKAGDPVDVPKGDPLTFAFKLGRFTEASIRRVSVRYLVVNKEQEKAEKGFVRIFDGKTLDGWTGMPQGSTAFKAGDEQIYGKLSSGVREAHLLFTEAVFKDFDLKFRVSGDSRNLIVLGRMGVKDKYQPTYATVTNYAAGGREWNQMEWIVKGKDVSLEVNGTKVWKQTAMNDQPLQIRFILADQGGGAMARIRDVQVKGTPVRATQKYVDLAKASGVTLGGADQGAPNPGGEGGAFGGRGNGQTSPSKDRGKRVLFDGKSLDDWTSGPAGVWSVTDGKMMGVTLDKKTGGEIRYAKLVFREYDLSFEVQKGTAGASFVAKVVPEKFGKKAPVIVKLEDSWFTQEWNHVEAICVDTTLKIRVNGKDVSAVSVPVEPGFIGFRIEKNSAIGVKDIVFHNPK